MQTIMRLVKSSKLFLFAMVSLFMGCLASGSRVHAFQIYTLSSATAGGGNPTRFGFIDSDTGIYTNIATLGVSPVRNLAARGEFFYTTRRVNTSSELGLLSRTGVFTLIGSANNIGRTVYGMGFALTGQLYGYDLAGTLGTINTTSGAWTTVGTSGVTMVTNATNPQGGRSSFLGSSLYSAARTATPAPTANRFGSIATAPVAFNTISNNALYQYMVLTSYQGTLYGVYSNGSTATPAVSPGIYSIDVATGNPTLVRNVTGFGSSFYLHGASAVPGPLPLLGAAAVFGSVRRLKTTTKRLAKLKLD
jgi:hypothetical protein